MLGLIVVVFIGAAVCSTSATSSCLAGFKVHTDCGTGGPGAVVLNVTSEDACCEACGGYSCYSWTYGPTSTDNGFPPHNCAIMSTATSPRNVTNHICGISNDPPPPPPVPGRKPCNADISCALQSEIGWRCEHDPSAALNASNNCHLAGPGTSGNASCACTTPSCSRPSYPYAHPTWPQYLQIGDSVSMGARPYTMANLTNHSVEGNHNPGNAASSNLGAHCQPGWLDMGNRSKWDVISFNYGLHDIAYDVERISVEQYTVLMTNVTAQLVAIQKQYGTKLIWVTTTPVPTVPTYSVTGPCNVTSKCLNPPRFDSDVQLYNAAAAKIVAAANNNGAKIETLDLYNVVLEACGGAQAYAKNACPGFQLHANVHFTATGWQTLADATVAAVLKVLQE